MSSGYPVYKMMTSSNYTLSVTTHSSGVGLSYAIQDTTGKILAYPKDPKLRCVVKYDPKIETWVFPMPQVDKDNKLSFACAPEVPEAVNCCKTKIEITGAT